MLHLDSLFRGAARPRMSRLETALYLLAGGVGAAFLITAYSARNQPLHQAGATAGILGMLAVGAFARIRRDGWRAYCRTWLRRDLAAAALWGMLLCVWVWDAAA